MPQSDKLTDREVKVLAADTPSKTFDGKGLYVEVTAAGAKSWRMKYRFAGVEKRLTFGLYPEVKLAEARRERDIAREMLRSGRDPGVHRKLTRAKQSFANSFETIAREWLISRAPTWSASHAKRMISFFENDMFPYLGARPITEISAPELLTTIRRVEKRVLERAHRGLQSCSQVFRYAIATGRCARNPAADLRGALPPHIGGHLAAPTDPKALAPLLRAMYGYSGTAPVAAALKLAPLVFVRPGELRHARWEDIDLEAAEWRYEATKTKQPHIVPLATQAVAILRELQPITGRGRYVFPSPRSSTRPMSDNAVLSALRRADIGKSELSGHGLRATARTILDEVLEFRPDIIEHQLAHAVRDPNGRAYNRTTHLPERRRMMQLWADYLDELRK